MSQPDINAKTRQAATDENALPLGGTTLIGTLTGPNGPVALVRLRRGTIRRIEKGDRLNGAQVAAIEDGRLLLNRAGQPEALSMPRS